uniref:Uncharacterized protein n=1 Tax=Stomoxys calcitrans TaxID=35570 RepID=A0A1I8NRB2_STOCA
MSTNSHNTDLYLRPLPFLDHKWIRADLISSLRYPEDAAILWNNLIQDCELVSSPAAPVLNAAGNLSYLGDDGKHYCGVQKLQCSCCPASDFCGPLSACNCSACHSLDSDATIKKITTQAQAAAVAAQRIASDAIFESWLWGQTPNSAAKVECQKTLLNELHDIALQAAGNCLSATHLRQQLFVYERYFVALARCKQQQQLQQQQAMQQHTLPQMQSAEVPKSLNPNNPFLNATDKNVHRFSEESDFSARDRFGKYRQPSSHELRSPGRDSERATLGLARVCTRAALNFSFFFLRRAWRSGEDTEMCSELLCEALESLQDLPEALLFDTSQ